MAHEQRVEMRSRSSLLTCADLTTTATESLPRTARERLQRTNQNVRDTKLPSGRLVLFELYHRLLIDSTTFC